MFRFFKELIDSAREGVEEAKAELAQEAAEQAAVARAAHAAAHARVAALSAYEKFVVALGAPYKQTFTRELASATEGRPVEYLVSLPLPPDEKVAAFQDMLNRDFGVTDVASLQTAYAAMLMTEVDPDDAVGDKPRSAVAIARLSYLACMGAAVGYVTPTQAFSMTAPLVTRAMAQFDGWADFGRCFVAGEKAATGSNALGSGFLKRSVDALLKEPASPWLTLPWPVSPADRDALLASRPMGHAAIEAG